MKRIIKKLSWPIRRFWLSEFEFSGKKFYYGTVLSSLLILAVFVYAVHYFGVIGVVVLFLKQTLRLVIAALAKITAKALLLLGFKRAVIDFMVMPVMKRSVFKHIIPAFIARLKDSRSRILRWVGMTFAGFSAIAIAIFAFLSNGWSLIQTAFMFVGGKLAASFGFKTVWALVGSGWGLLVKYWAVIKTTPLGVLIQVYILSKITDLLVKLIPERARMRLRPIKDWCVQKFWSFQGFIDKIFGWHLEERMKKIARWIEPPAERKKRHHERLILALERKKLKEKKGWQHPDDRISGFRNKDARRQKLRGDQKRKR